MAFDESSLMGLLLNRLPQNISSAVSSLLSLDKKTAVCNTSQVAFASPQAVYVVAKPNEWNVQSEYTTQQASTVIKAANAGSSLCITDIYIAVNGTVSVTMDDSDGNAVFKYYGSSTGDGVSKRFQTPLRMRQGKSLRVTSSTAVSFFISVTGYDALA